MSIVNTSFVEINMNMTSMQDKICNPKNISRGAGALAKLITGQADLLIVDDGVPRLFRSYFDDWVDEFLETVTARMEKKLLLSRLRRCLKCYLEISWRSQLMQVQQINVCIDLYTRRQQHAHLKMPTAVCWF